ncbi:MAG: DUF447 domain-containing protein [Candidatus Bathyarchaeia archaeon]
MPIISTDVSRLLDELGFSYKGVVETIVTTYGMGKEPNAAPMGVVRTGSKELEIRPYRGSQTFLNLEAKRAAVINLTHDAEIFYVTAFKDEEGRRIREDWFEKAEIVNAPRLRQTDASIEVSAVRVRSLSNERVAFPCEAKLVEVRKLTPRAFSRGTSAALEAIIHATRIRRFFQTGRAKDAERLAVKVDDLKDVVQRVCPDDSTQMKIMNGLAQKIETWRKKWSKKLS